MAATKERFIVDDQGERLGILLDLEELESIRAYDVAKAAKDSAVPFEDAVAEIERRRE